MPDNPLLVALLRELRDEALTTRTEAGRMTGRTRGQIAGVCDRNQIIPWPLIPKEIVRKRSCCFPIGQPGEDEFHLCGKQKAPGHSLLCTEHERKKWTPQAKVLAMLRKVTMLRSRRCT